MVISTWIVYDQLNYLRNKDLGFDKDNMITLRLTTPEMLDKLPVFKQSLRSKPGILKVGSANARVGYDVGKTIHLVETSDGMVERGINNMTVDHDFINTLNITLMDGRDFREDTPSDTIRSVIINETLAKRLNWNEPIGKKINIYGDTSNVAQVVGLIKDYHQFGLYNVMESLMFIYYPKCYLI